jgi:hypothetical protein
VVRDALEVKSPVTDEYENGELVTKDINPPRDEVTVKPEVEENELNVWNITEDFSIKSFTL